MQKNRKKLFAVYFLISIILLAAVFFLSLLCGSEHISLENFLKSFSDSESVWHTIIFTLRFPRGILAVLSGALLAGCGAAFQMFFRNSLAEPGIIGISAGATLGAVICQSFGAAGFILFVNPLNIAAFFGALISGIIITVIAARFRGQNSVTVLLCGTALGTLYSSVSSILLLTRSKELSGIYFWILGSFNGRGWNEVKFTLIPAVIAFLMIFLISKPLDLMIGGESSAQSLGMNVKKLRILVLLASAFGVSVSVCAGGTINFAGLIAPHIVRRISGPDFSSGKYQIPFSMIYGAILVLLSDMAARTVIAPSEIPAGLITSLLGAPFFISLIFKREGAK